MRLWNWIKGLFKKDKPANLPIYKNPIDEAIEATRPKPLGPIGNVEVKIGLIVAEEIKNYPEILKENPSVEYWQSVFKAMAYAESGFNPLSRYVEKGISDKDLITGKANVSEGLFQLSYQDSKIHGCPFDWSIDKSKGLLDPSKTIFDVRNNTVAAMIILNKQLGKGLGMITKGKPYYWAVLDTSRPGHKNFLSKFVQYRSTKVELPVKESSDGSDKKIAILIGHGQGDGGATCWNGTTEHDYNKKVAEIIKSKMPNVTLYFKSKVGDWAPVYVQMAVSRPDVSIELHLNAYNGQAKGCEVLITSEAARSLGEKFASMFCLKFGRVMRGSRGIKWLGNGDRGFGNVYSASKVSKKAILLESFFCDNKAEWIDPEVYAEFLIGFLKEL